MQQAAAERGAITAGLVGTVTGMLVVVSLGLYFVLRKASHAGGCELWLRLLDVCDFMVHVFFSFLCVALVFWRVSPLVDCGGR